MIHVPRENFYSEIEEGFSSLIQRYNLNVVKREGNRRVILSNSMCHIVLLDTEDGLEIYFQQPNGPKSYQVNLVFECIHGEIRVPWKSLSTADNLNDYIEYSKEIGLHFDKVLLGDFSWTSRYDALEAEQKGLIEKILSLDKNHPISKLFWNQDMDWKKEARRILKY